MYTTRLLILFILFTKKTIPKNTWQENERIKRGIQKLIRLQGYFASGAVHSIEQQKYTSAIGQDERKSTDAERKDGDTPVGMDTMLIAYIVDNRSNADIGNGIDSSNEDSGQRGKKEYEQLGSMRLRCHSLLQGVYDGFDESAPYNQSTQRHHDNEQYADTTHTAYSGHNGTSYATLTADTDNIGWTKKREHKSDDDRQQDTDGQRHEDVYPTKCQKHNDEGG